MPLIQSAITWSTEKVSASLKNHQDSNAETLPAQDIGSTTSGSSLSRQSNEDYTAESRNNVPDPVQLNENLDIEQQSTSSSSNSEFLPKRTPPSPPPSTIIAQDEQPKQNTSNQLTNPDTDHRSRSPILPQPTPAYPPPAQSQSTTIPPQYTVLANEDRNRADYYQAKYYESQCLQGQYQGQSAQYGDDCGMVSNQQQPSDGTRRGGGGGRERGRRGGGGGGLIAFVEALKCGIG